MSKLLLSVLCVVAVFSFFMLSGAQGRFGFNTVQAGEMKETIDVDELTQLLAEKDKPFLLDVRQPQEFEEGHIEGAVLIPLDKLQERLSEIPTDRPIVVYCRSGNRSSHAAYFLRENGYTQVENLNGGMISWKEKHPCDEKKKVC